MKHFILTFILAVMAFPAMAQDSTWLKHVEAQFVCMVNNQSYDTPQIAVEVEGKTYYGCCPMCKAKLEKVPAIRAATDPVSGNAVDKAQAVIGTGPDKTVYYFENEENLQKFASGPMPTDTPQHHINKRQKHKGQIDVHSVQKQCESGHDCTGDDGHEKHKH